VKTEQKFVPVSCVLLLYDPNKKAIGDGMLRPWGLSYTVELWEGLSYTVELWEGLGYTVELWEGLSCPKTKNMSIISFSFDFATSCTGLSFSAVLFHKSKSQLRQKNVFSYIEYGADLSTVPQSLRHFKISDTLAFTYSESDVWPPSSNF
jgi:hypothetical protein